MSAVAALIADIKSFQMTHGNRPRRIRMHPFDINEIQAELFDGVTPDAGPPTYSAAPDSATNLGPDWVMSFMGIPIYRAYDAVIARPWLDV